MNDNEVKSLNNKYKPQNERFYIRFWGKVEKKFVYKMIFALMYGLCWALFAVLMAVLLLRDVDFKWTLVLVGFAFIVSLTLSPFQYKRFSKSYRDHMKFHQDKNTQTFIEKIGK